MEMTGHHHIPTSITLWKEGSKYFELQAQRDSEQAWKAKKTGFP
jgi:hypothetical protein